MASDREARMEHIRRGPWVRAALRTIMVEMQEGWRGSCGCGNLRTCGRCEGLDAAHDKVERALWTLAEQAQALAAPPSAQDGWQPIETAPQDGSYVLLAKGNAVTVARWTEYAWWELNNDPSDAWGAPWYESEPTAWMPLPPPPAGAPRICTTCGHEADSHIAPGVCHERLPDQSFCCCEGFTPRVSK